MFILCLTEHVAKKFKSGQEVDKLNDVTSDDVDCISVSHLSPVRPATVRRSTVSRRIPDSDFMAVTGFEGQRVYVTMKTESYVQRQVIWLHLGILLLTSRIFLLVRMLISLVTFVILAFCLCYTQVLLFFH